MAKPLSIMFDIDGVLADFSYSLTLLANHWYGVAPRNSSHVKTWDYSEILSKKEFHFLLDVIKTSADFWANLTLAPEVSIEDLGRIEMLNRTNQVYFVTSRLESGNTIQQTREWLLRHGISLPSVIMSKRKGEVARVIDADYSIDDKWENAQCVHWLSDAPQTKSYLINRPYNQLADDKVGSKKIIRVNTIKEYLDDIERGL